MSKVYLKLLLTTMLLLMSSTASKVQCQYQGSKWARGKNLKVTDREVLVSTIYGVDVIVDGYDGTVSRNIQGSGQWQANNLRNMAQFVNKGNTVINIGSHIGLQAIVLGKQLGQTGKLFIFEPFSVSFNMVLKNVFLNDLEDITTVFNVAGGNKKTKGFISVSNFNTGGSQIFTDPTVRDAPFKTEEVSVDLVDNVLPKDTIVDFALIDVQRFEVQCLQGMKQTIARSPNMVIMCEWSGISYNTRDINKKTEELLNWFVQRKYKFYQLDWNRGNCQNSKYVEMGLKAVLGVRNLIDVFFIPGHIDPNKPQ